MRKQQQLQLLNKQQEPRKFNGRLLFFFISVCGALAITVVWILSGLSIIPSTWAIILSAIVTVLGVVIGLWPLIFPLKKFEPPSITQSKPPTPQNVVQVPIWVSKTQEVTAARYSEITEPEQ